MSRLGLWSLIFVVAIVAAILEACLVARATIGVFDPRCLMFRGYVVAHRYDHGKEAIWCARETL